MGKGTRNRRKRAAVRRRVVIDRGERGWTGAKRPAGARYVEGDPVLVGVLQPCLMPGVYCSWYVRGGGELRTGGGIPSQFLSSLRNLVT